MSVKLQISQQASVHGKSFGSEATVETDGSIVKDLDVAAAKTGNLTTRTDNDTGVLTMDGSHGITTGARLDLYWGTGKRVGMTVGTVAGAAVPIDGGVGDNLPADESEITAMVPLEVPAVFDGDSAKAIVAMGLAAQGTIILAGADDATDLQVDLVSGLSYVWYLASGAANPIVGDDITQLFVSHGDTVERNMRLTAMVDDIA